MFSLPSLLLDQTQIVSSSLGSETVLFHQLMNFLPFNSIYLNLYTVEKLSY